MKSSAYLRQKAFEKSCVQWKWEKVPQIFIKHSNATYTLSGNYMSSLFPTL